MSQIAPRMSRSWWPLWCRRAWWGGMEPGQNFSGRRGGLGLGRRCFDDLDATVGWGRGFGRGLGRGWGYGACRNFEMDACRRGLGPEACRRSDFQGLGRRWLDDMDSPIEFGAGQRWMGPGGMGRGRGPWSRRPWWWRNNDSLAADDKVVEVKCDADVYQVKLNVSDFAPDDVSVRVRSGEVVVEAAHPELPAEHGTTSRQFTRRFVLPEGVEEETLESEFTEDGFLLVSGRMKVSAPDRTIDIKKA